MTRKLRTRLKSERGQALILFVGAFTIIAIAGAIAIDFSLWFSERRGAQTDADLPALAGAQEYMRQLAVPGYTEDALGKASAFFDDNNTANAGNASLPVPIEAISPCVKVTVKRDTKALFTGIFGIGPENIGADAKACAGSLSGQSGIVPVTIPRDDPACFDNGAPVYTSVCLLEGGSDTENPRGMLDLDAPPDYCSNGPGNGDIENLISNGAPGNCRINPTATCDPDDNGPWYDCVAVQDGNTNQVIDGFLGRIDREGSCDIDQSGIEDFDETVNVVVDSGDPRTSLYEARTCPNGEISPRIISIIVIATTPTSNPGNTGLPIVGIATFYVGGCWDAGPPGQENPPPTSIDELDRDCSTHIPDGQIAIYGEFVLLSVTDGDIGDPNPSSTQFGVALVE